MKAAVPYIEVFKKIYKDPQRAAVFLNNVLEEGDLDDFLLALRDVAEIHGGLSKVARMAGLNREHLYRMLSKNGNPGLRNMIALLHALGYKMVLEQQKMRKAA